MTDDRPEIAVPKDLPQPGFYYHYKHDPHGPEHEAAYEVTGAGWHTETQEFSVMYRPLYEGWAYDAKLTYLRPYAMFTENVEKPEYSGPRFIHIMEAELVSRLEGLRDAMYGED